MDMKKPLKMTYGKYLVSVDGKCPERTRLAEPRGRKAAKMAGIAAWILVGGGERMLVSKWSKVNAKNGGEDKGCRLSSVKSKDMKVLTAPTCIEKGGMPSDWDKVKRNNPSLPRLSNYKGRQYPLLCVRTK